MDYLNTISLNCTNGPEQERFAAVLKSHAPECDVVAKAEQLIRVSSVAAIRNPRRFSVAFKFESGLQLQGVYTTQRSDLHSRGFLDNFLVQLKAEEDLRQQRKPNVVEFPTPPLQEEQSEFSVISEFTSLTCQS